MRIPLSAPDIIEAEIEAVASVLRTPHLSLGPKLAEFEACFSAFTGVPYAAAVSSGTAGLHLALIALGISAGDEVIVPSFTFIAAANAIRYVGAVPVFVDIDPSSLNMSPACVEAAITPRTRAILAVHTFGRPAEIARLRAIARSRDLFLIEDACESLGAEGGRKKIGSFGDIAVFAFYPNKQITAGEGGMVVTSDPALAARIRSLRNQGRSASGDWFQHIELGYNYRLSEIACALGIGQMGRLPEILRRRDEIAHAYARHLGNQPSLILPALEVPDTRISWFVYAIRLAPAFSTSRDRIIGALHDVGIGAGRYFAPIHLQPAYTAPVATGTWRAAPLPVTEAVAPCMIALPFFNRITEEQIAEVAETLTTAIVPLAS